MLTGIFCALGAGLMWGLVFIAPLILQDYPGMLLSFGRYLAFGMIAIIPAMLNLEKLRQLKRADWWVALKLSCVGNIIYYAALATAIQFAGAPLPSVIIGTLPLVIAICSNWHEKSVAWKKLIPILLLILCGLLLVNIHEIQALQNQAKPSKSLITYILGIGLALFALAAWTWYPMVNSRYMRNNKHIAPSTWATAQGLSTLPLATIGYGLYLAYLYFTQTHFALPLGPRPVMFVGMMLIIGLCASWLGTLLWNKASQLLPTALAGQLIIFETLAALVYAFVWSKNWPSLTTIQGVFILLMGVIFGIRLFRQVNHD